MIDQARNLARSAPNIVVKIAMTFAGFQALKQLKAEEIKPNATLIFLVAQGSLVANTGATYISPKDHCC